MERSSESEESAILVISVLSHPTLNPLLRGRIRGNVSSDCFDVVRLYPSCMPRSSSPSTGSNRRDIFNGSSTRSKSGARNSPNVLSRKRSSSMAVRSTFSSGSFSTTTVRTRSSFGTTTPVRRHFSASPTFHRRHKRCRSSRHSYRSSTVSIVNSRSLDCSNLQISINHSSESVPERISACVTNHTTIRFERG